MLGADLVVETLKGEGIKLIFSLPGGQLLPIYYAVKDRPEMETIFCRHEGAATLMASGYSMITGKPSCVMATVGAGIAYEAGPLFFAWRERLPVISIAPQVQSYKMKPIQENLQACDQDDIFRPITKFNAIMYHRDRIPYLIRRAVKAAVAPETGPVHLDVPMDVMYGFKRVSRSKRKDLFPLKMSRYEGELYPSQGSLDEAARLIASAKRPVVLVGRALERCRGGDDLMAFLETAAAPAIRSIPAYATVSPGSKYNAGIAKTWDNADGIEMLAQADLVVLIEADEETAIICRKLYAEKKMKVIHVSATAAAIGSIVPDETGVFGSPIQTLRDISALIRKMSVKSSRDLKWIDAIGKKCAALQERYGELFGSADNISVIGRVIKEVSEALQPDDILICEGEKIPGITLSCLNRIGNHNTFLLNDDIVSGSGLPLAIGMKLACKSRKVLLLTEASSFKQHIRELQTMVRYGAGVVVIVFQDKPEKPAEEVNFASLASSLGTKGRFLQLPGADIQAVLSDKHLPDARGIVFDATNFQ
jgi:acetolactate synthase-1/2/3 large subunit